MIMQYTHKGNKSDIKTVSEKFSKMKMFINV